MEFAERWPLFANALFAAIFYLCAAMFHTYRCVDHKTHERCKNYYRGALALFAAGSMTPLIYYGLMCDPYWQAMWLREIWVICLLAVMIIVCKPKVANLSFHVVVCSIIPPLFFMFNKLEYTYIIAIVLYILAAVNQITRLPEIYVKRSCDILGASQQVSNMLFIVASMLQFWDNISMFHTRQLHPC
jgi:predicted membrane channel-forming protein YqfA (hemolysin III family)